MRRQAKPDSSPHHLDRKISHFGVFDSCIRAERLPPYPVFDGSQEPWRQRVTEQRVRVIGRFAARGGGIRIEGLFLKNRRTHSDAFVTDVSSRMIAGARK
jgi:hypothetical protein